MIVGSLLRRSVGSIRVDGVLNDYAPKQIPGAQFNRITSDIKRLCAGILPTSDQIQEKNTFLGRLQQSIHGVLDDAVVSPFGSVVNGFWSPNSDIDVCVQVPGCRTRASQIEALRKVASCLHSISSHYIEPRFTARVPIIHWAPRKNGYLACDISINNSLAVVNSKLIGAYSAIDFRVVELGMTIKFWANARGINDRSRGTLSSFSLLLMLIHFLQRRSPPILPSLQDLALEKNEPPSYCMGSDIRYVNDTVMIQEEMARLSLDHGVSNPETSGELLLEFFRYYGYTYKSGIIGIRDLRSFHSSVLTDSQVYLVVDNPFEVGKDVANVNNNQHSRIRQEFRRAFSLLESGSNLDEVFSAPELSAISASAWGKTGGHPIDPPTRILGQPRAARNPRHTRQR
jgi:DNA polymerase sigma